MPGPIWLWSMLQLRAPEILTLWDCLMCTDLKCCFHAYTKHFSSNRSRISQSKNMPRQFRCKSIMKREKTNRTLPNEPFQTNSEDKGYDADLTQICDLAVSILQLPVFLRRLFHRSFNMTSRNTLAPTTMGRSQHVVLSFKYSIVAKWGLPIWHISSYFHWNKYHSQLRSSSRNWHGLESTHIH